MNNKLTLEISCNVILNSADISICGMNKGSSYVILAPLLTIEWQ